MKNRNNRQAICRTKASREYQKYRNNNQTREEGLAFGNGFNSGWKAHMHLASKYLFEELSNLLNNLNDDLKLDLSVGENGYKSYEDSYKAVNKFTLMVLKKKFKQAEHNFLLGHRKKAEENKKEKME
ncbi:MAG: hypothetical protein WC781_05820 [Candidatus Pacearchaeota archaeon]|jgi:hypothetical protein